MAQTRKIPLRLLAINLPSLCFILAWPLEPTLALNLTTPTNTSESDNFQTITGEFLDSNPIGLDNFSAVTLASSLDTASLKILLETTPLAPVNPYSPALSLASVADSLSQIEIKGQPKPTAEVNIPILAQTTAPDAYEGVYGVATAAPRPLEQLVGSDPLKFSPTAISLTKPPQAYIYNNNSVNISIFKTPSLNVDFLGADRAQVVSFNGPSVTRGLQLNRIVPQINAANDSTLQLWPRTPFNLEVTDNLVNFSSSSFVATETYGNLSINVNFPTLPKEVFLTPFDLSVDWVNTGGYSQNLRSNIDIITDYHRNQQAQFQDRVQTLVQERTKQQLEAQSKIQQRVALPTQVKSRTPAYPYGRRP